MRFTSQGDIPRVDPRVLRRFVPASWAEWAALRFDPDGRVLDPDAGVPLGVLTLSEGAHRSPGARYTLRADAVTAYTFTLAEDDGRTVRGTLAGPPGTLRVALGHQVSAAGRGTLDHAPGAPRGGPSGEWNLDVTTGDRWRADGHAGVVGSGWSAELTLERTWQLSARVDVRTLLLANDVPGWAIGLIGGGEATLELTIDPAVLHGRGDLVSGRARAQRVAVAGELTVRAASDVWHGRLTLHLHGRGPLGRSALLAARPAVRRAVRPGLTEFWSDLHDQADSARTTLDDLAGGDPAVRVHQQLWDGLRAAERADVEASARPVPPVSASPAVTVGGSRDRGRRSSLPLVAAGLVLVLLTIVVLVVVGIARSSSGGGSATSDTSAPPLQIRHEAVAAFTGTDLGTAVATSAVTAGSRLVPETAADELTGRDAGTIWNTAAIATAPGGARYYVFVVAVDLKTDPHRPDAVPTLTDSDTVGTAAGLGAGWRRTTELGPFSGTARYPSAATVSGRTLLIVHLDITPGADAELQRLTTQLTPQVRRRYVVATRP